MKVWYGYSLLDEVAPIGVGQLSHILTKKSSKAIEEKDGCQGKNCSKVFMSSHSYEKGVMRKGILQSHLS
jgi:hypothetical protein